MYQLFLRNFNNLLWGNHDKSFKRTVTFNLIARILNFILFFLSLKLTLPYLGTERFGIFSVIISYSLFLSILDLGVGNSLTNRIAINLGDKKALENIISNGLLLLVIQSIFLLLIFLFLFHIININSLFKLSNKVDVNEVYISLLWFIFIFCVSIIGNGILRILYGLQLAYLSYIYNAIGSLTSIIVLFFIANKEAQIHYLILCSFGIPTFFNIFSYLKLKKYIDIKFKVNYGSLVEFTKSIYSQCLFFAFMQLAAAVSSGADLLFVSILLGAESAAEFSILQKISMIITQPLAMYNGALWGVYACLKANDNWPTLSMTFKKAFLKSLFASSILAIGFVITSDKFILLITDNKISIEFSLIIVFSFWVILESCAGCIGVYLNSTNVVREQIITISFFIIVSIILKYYSTKIYGANGLVIAAIVSYLITQGFLYGFIFRKRLFKFQID